MINLFNLSGPFLQSSVHELCSGILVVGEKFSDRPEEFLRPEKDGNELIKVLFLSCLLKLIQSRAGQGELAEGAVHHGICRTKIFYQACANHRNEIPGKGYFFIQKIKAFA